MFGGPGLKKKAVPGCAAADHHIGYLTTLKSHPPATMGMILLPCHVIMLTLKTVNR